MGRLPNLEFSLQHAILQKKGNYEYLVSPLESIPCALSADLIAEIVEEIIRIGVVEEMDIIVCLEAMGIHLGAVLSQQTGKPLSIARKKKHNIKPRIKFTCRTNYAQRTYYLYGSFTGKRILIIDDIIAGGDTLRQTVIALQGHGAIVKHVLVVVAREGEYESTFQEMGIEFKALSKVKVVEDRIEIVHIS